MDEGDWQLVILHYLRQKGYTDAASALSRATQVEENGEMALSSRLNVHRGVVDHLLSHFSSDSDPKSYSDAFNRLAEWTDNSLDLYRGELQRVLYPVFLHCYLRLVGMDATATASMMLNRYRRRLLDSCGQLSRSRTNELQELQSVATKQHLESNRLAKKLLAPGSKSTVSLSTYSHDLVHHYLHSAPEMMPINVIVSQRIQFETVEGRPAGAADDGAAADDDGDAAAAGGAGGGADHEAAATNQAVVELGLLTGNIEDRYVEQLQQKAAPSSGAAAAAATTDDGATKMEEDGEGVDGEEGGGAVGGAAGGGAKKPSRKRPTATVDDEGGPAALALKQWDPSGPRVEPKPFVPTLPEEVSEQWMRDLEARVHVDSTAESAPSCCFFTFVNTRHTLTSAAFSRDAAKVAAGFSDSTVRLYDVQQLGRRPAGTSSQRHLTTSSPKPTTTNMDLDAEEEDNDTTAGVQYMYGHTAAVHAVEFTPDMRLLLTASSDGSARVWSVEMASALAAFKGHLLPVWDVASSPLGYLFATASADRTARVWATDSVKPLRILSGHQSDVDVVRWHPNCHYVATASSDRTVRLWDVHTGSCVRHLSGGHAAFTSLAMSPDGLHAAAGCEDGSILIWDLGSAKRVATLSGHHVGPVWSLAYSCGRGSVLASGGDDETVRLWNNDKISDMDAAATAVGGGASGSLTAADDAHAAAKNSSHKGVAYAPLRSFRAKSSPAISLTFSARNLLLAAGPFNLKHRIVPTTGTQA